MAERTSKLLAFAVTVVLLLVSFNLLASSGNSGTRQDLTLKAAVKADLATTNIIRASDLWTKGELFPAYMTVGLLSPDFSEIYPYILKGVDADDSGVLDSDEYGVFAKEDTTDRRSVTAFYDLNGVLFHDGVQATKEDVLFSYHVNALRSPGDAFVNSLDILKDESDQQSSNYSTDRWLWVYPVNDIWDPEVPVGQDASLTFALRFELQSDYYGFVHQTLSNLILLPRHIWEGSGMFCIQAESGVCQDWETDIHQDFGRAYDPIVRNGVPIGSVDAFNMSAAGLWVPEDRHVIGTGPFEFTDWVEGSSVRLDRFDAFHTDVVDRNGGAYLHKPYIEGILFKVYKTLQAAVFALQAGEVDMTAMVSIPPEFVNDLLRDPYVSLRTTADYGPFYLGYNVRHSPFGYPDNDPTQGDVGYYLRKAIAHTIDKKTILTTILQNFGVGGDQPISPASVKWYNESVPKYDFDLVAAGEILDDHYTIGGHALGYGPSGFRNLPVIGDSEIEIVTYMADFEPRCSHSVEMIASNMMAVGINARMKVLAYADVIQRVQNRDVQMWLLPEEIASEPPDYLHELFYSGSARGGRNYAGFQNQTFDDLILQARSEFDVVEQVRLVKEASGLLADALPIDVIFYRINIEAYRRDRFINWTTGLTGSHIRESLWTLTGIRPPPVLDMTVSIEAPSAMESTSTEAFRISVWEYDGVLPDVRVRICVQLLTPHPSPGNITLGDQRGQCVSGISDFNGNIVAVYEAPDIGEREQLQIQIEAEAESEFRISRTASAFIRIYPKEKAFLSVKVTMEAGDVVAIGYTLPLTIEVRDQTGMRVDDATVNLTSVPEGLALEPLTGLTTGGSIGQVMVTPPTEMGDKDYLRFNVVADVELEGYESTMGMSEVVVIELTPAPAEHVGSSDIAIMLVLTLVSAVVVLWLIRLRLNSRSREP